MAKQRQVDMRLRACNRGNHFISFPRKPEGLSRSPEANLLKCWALGYNASEAALTLWLLLCVLVHAVFGFRGSQVRVGSFRVTI